MPRLLGDRVQLRIIGDSGGGYTCTGRIEAVDATDGTYLVRPDDACLAHDSALPETLWATEEEFQAGQRSR